MRHQILSDLSSFSLSPATHRFYQDQTENHTKSTKALVHNYLTSVGRAANLILNVAPDGTGAVPPSDVARYAEMGTAIECLFSKPLAKSSNHSIPPFGAMEKTTGVIEWALPPTGAACTNCSLVLMEDLSAGQLIGNFSLLCQSECAAADVDSGGCTAGAEPWKPCELGMLAGLPPSPHPIFPKDLAAGVGHKRIVLLAAGSPLLGLRLVVKTHYATGAQVPRLRSMELYDWGGEVESCV
eukprot:SAG22_NODE_342_length_11973_cov_10.127927_4_plen_240_part_00